MRQPCGTASRRILLFPTMLVFSVMWLAVLLHVVKKYAGGIAFHDWTKYDTVMSTNTTIITTPVHSANGTTGSIRNPPTIVEGQQPGDDGKEDDHDDWRTINTINSTTTNSTTNSTINNDNTSSGASSSNSSIADERPLLLHNASSQQEDVTAGLLSAARVINNNDNNQQEKTNDSRNDNNVTRTATNDDCSHDANQHRLYRLQDDFRKCMLDLEQVFYKMVPYWHETQQPSPYSVMIIEDQYYVLLSLAHAENAHIYKWHSGGVLHYKCNGIEGGTEVTRVAPGKDWLRHLMVVKCPETLNASVTELEEFSIHLKPGQTDAKGADTAVYDVRLMDQCQRRDIAYFDEKFKQNEKPVKTGIVTIFNVNGKSRKDVLLWAAYHHLIGFDHIFMYVNEPWNDGAGLKAADYITFIPYNNRLQDYFHMMKNSTHRLQFPHFDIFRVTAMNDALWRGKRMGMDWMSFPDLDEFVTFGHHTPQWFQDYHSGKNMTNIDNHTVAPLMQYLDTFNDVMKDENYASILLKSLPFGRNMIDPEDDYQRESTLQYIYRPDIDLPTCCMSRSKHITKVAMANSLNLHYVPGNSYIPHTCELRVNHYKRPNEGVFNTKAGIIRDGQGLVKDTQLRDDYLELAMKHMNESMYDEQNCTSSAIVTSM